MQKQFQCLFQTFVPNHEALAALLVDPLEGKEMYWTKSPKVEEELLVSKINSERKKIEMKDERKNENE